MKRATMWAGTVAVLALSGGSVAFREFTLPAKATETHRSTAIPVSTASIERGDLSESSQVDGTLGFRREQKINAAVTGVMTWTPPPGSIVRRDGVLYQVNGNPVRLMYGRSPMYRALKSHDKGEDVRQVEENLAALGYTGFTVDNEYTYRTAEAVKRWQKEHGLEQTGSLGTDQIAFAAGRVKIKSDDIPVGDLVAPGQPALTTTASERIVSLQVDVGQSRLIRPGTKVTVDLPDGTTADGRVASVANTATPGTDPDDKSPKIKLTVIFVKPGSVTGLDQSPVTVNLNGTTHKNVLSVPVGALLALPTGGFGVQVI
jgi:peptidoglycan hydrolase-like protein with peptidoglycan-binding domain